MFHELVCFLFTCLNIIACAPGSSFYSDHTGLTRMPLQYTTKSMLQNNRLLHKYHRGLEAKQLQVTRNRSKRGIVLIDEDFNVPPEPGVKQGWSDGDIDRNLIETATKNATSMFNEHGSGSSEIIEAESLPTKSTHYVTPEELQRTSESHKATSAVEYTDLEGSGDVIISSTQVSITAEFINVTFPSTYVTVISEIPTEAIDEPISKLCLNFTCDSKDLIILSSLSRTVPEGSNLTLFCALANVTEQGILKWYKYNESDHFMLEESNKGHELNFGISQTRQHHSGTYICLRFTEQSCCHRKLDIIVYEMPNYKNHFIILGGVIAASLLVCILLGILRSMKVKKYKQEIELQNVEKPFLL